MWKKWFDAIPPWIHNAPIASHFYTFPSAGSRHYDYIWSESQGSQEEEAINAYWHTTRIGKIIMDEPFWYYGAGYPIKVWVSEYDGESPYYNPSTEELWFTRYYNYHWALSSDCIYHEYGHHIIWNVYGKDFIGGTNPTSQSRAMEEGFADYLACTINDDCLSGEDVPIPGSLPRNLDNQLMYPYNMINEAHHDGQIIAGAVWDLRTYLGKYRGDYLFLKALRIVPQPVDFFEYLENTLIADDDNANLSDGTPHDPEILHAFKNHGITLTDYLPHPYNLHSTLIEADKIYLEWDRIPYGEDGFIVQRWTQETGWIDLPPTPYLWCHDENLQPAKTYQYRVVAYKGSLRSGPSNTITVQTIWAPYDLFANPVVYEGVQIYWTDDLPDEEGFKIEKKIGTGSYSVVHTTGPNETSWYDDDIENYSGQQVRYRVRAFTGNYISDTSNSVVIPSAPGIFTDSLKAIGNHVHNAGYFNCRSLRRANDGACHLVLVHHGRIWYTKSTNNGTTWQLAIPLTEQNPSTPSLAINSYNHPCFVWDETNAQGNHMLTYAYQDISGNIHKFALLTKPNRLYPSIAISPSDLVYIAYVEDSTYSAGKVKRVEFNYDNPVASNPVVYNTAGPQGISITTDPLGNPHLVWIHRYMGHSIKYAGPDGSIETVGGGDAPDIIASSVNNVRVVWASSGEIYYRERTNSGWGNSIIVTQDPAVGNNVYFPRITHNNAVLFKGTFTPEPGNIFGVQPSVFSTLATLLTANTRYYDAVPLPGGTTPTVLLATQRNTSVTGLYKIAFLIKPIPLRLPHYWDIIYSLPSGPPVEFTAYNNSRRLIRDASGVLHLAFTSGNNIYHTFLQDTSWAEPEFVAQGMYPSLLSGDGNLYSIYAHNEPYPAFLEELRFAKRDATGWTVSDFPVAHTYNSFLWGIGAPSFAIKDTIGYFTFESIFGPQFHPLSDSGYVIMMILRQGQALVYGKFSLNHPENFQYQIIDSYSFPIIPVDTFRYREIVKDSLVSPSIAVDNDGVVHILWEGRGDSLRYYRIVDTVITREFYPGNGIDYPFITMREDQIDHFWCDAESIKYRYGWTGTENLSETQAVASCESPISSGQYLTWTKREDGISHLYYGAIPASGTINPIEINYSTDLISYPQILFNPKPPSIDLVWTEYSEIDSIGNIYYLNLPLTEVAPKYAFDMGTETPVPILVQRDGYKVLGTEDYKTFDYDSTELVYHLTLHSPHTKYRIRWTWYHEEQNKIKLQFNIDDIFHHNKWVKPGEKIIEESWIPDACVQDNEITIKVKVLNGTIAVLSGFEIYAEEVGGGGPQGSEAQITRPFYFDKIYPNPTKGIFKIRYNSPDNRKLTIKLYDVCGRLVHSQEIIKSKIGINEVLIKPDGLSAGVYFVRLETDGYQKVEKAILLR
ncbi:MAG: T9SS type A sorting domain-containing protein [candidate division WOR-3 bacterium]